MLKRRIKIICVLIISGAFLGGGAFYLFGEHFNKQEQELYDICITQIVADDDRCVALVRTVALKREAEKRIIERKQEAENDLPTWEEAISRFDNHRNSRTIFICALSIFALVIYIVLRRGRSERGSKEIANNNAEEDKIQKDKSQKRALLYTNLYMSGTLADIHMFMTNGIPGLPNWLLLKWVLSKLAQCLAKRGD